MCVIRNGKSVAVALTGGIACGKSEVAGILKAGGVPVIDSDELAHALLAPDHRIHEQVIGVFGAAVTSPEGGIDRRKLAALVFSDADAREKLNAIMHPEIYRQIFAWLDAQAATHAVAMIPLLYETGAEKQFDRVLVVAADEEQAMRRMRTRGWSEQEAKNRMAAQWPVAEKVRRADAVIYNNKDLNHLKGETWKIWKQVTEGKE